jgi:hypothetical protein
MFSNYSLSHSIKDFNTKLVISTVGLNFYFTLEHSKSYYNDRVSQMCFLF